MKLLVQFKLLASICLLTIMLASCSKTQKAQNTENELACKCCKECSEAFSQSPAAVSPEGAKCGQFTTGNPISKECLEYFEKHPTTVAECLKSDTLK
jgi:hypothetical protein